MVKYIELSELQKFCKKYTEYDAVQLILNDRTDLISTADVIERSKIDKAIAELRKEIEENHLNVIDYADGEWIVKDFVYGAIDRLREKLIKE